MISLKCGVQDYITFKGFGFFIFFLSLVNNTIVPYNFSILDWWKNNTNHKFSPDTTRIIFLPGFKFKNSIWSEAENNSELEKLVTL